MNKNESLKRLRKILWREMRNEKREMRNEDETINYEKKIF